MLIDVGANTGQYASMSRGKGYKGFILSFEPLKLAHAQLLLNSQYDKNWLIHRRCAVGAASGKSQIFISKNSWSSSLLNMCDKHILAAPDSLFIGKEDVDVITLDSVFDHYRGTYKKIFLKIDTQGFEDKVLEGVSGNLMNIFGIQIELSVIPLYEGQKLYDYFFNYFIDNGFILWSIIPGLVDMKNGQLLQFDAIFIRKI